MLSNLFYSAVMVKSQNEMGEVVNQYHPYTTRENMMVVFPKDN